MDLLRENFFADSSYYRLDKAERFETAHALQEPLPRKLDAAAARRIDRCRKTPAFIGDFVSLDGGRNLIAQTEGITFVHDGELGVLLRMRPGLQGFGRSAQPKRKDVWPAVWVHLDLAHGHHNAVVFHAPLFEAAAARTMWTCEGSLVTDLNRGDGKRKLAGGWSVQSKILDGCWLLLLKVKLARFGLTDVRKQPVIGFQIMRMQSSYNHVEESCWSPSRIWRPSPTCYGEMALAPSEITVRSIDVSDPMFGMNRAIFELSNLLARPVELTLRSQTVAPNLRTGHAVTVRIPARKTVKALLPYETSILDWSEQVVTFGIEGDGGRRLYRASYRAGVCYSSNFGASYLLLKHRLSVGVRRGLPAPAMSDPDFYAKKRLYVLSNMPDFHRDPKGSNRIIIGRIGKRTVVRFDLEKSGVLRRIGGYLEGLFENDDDRILAAMYFAHHTSTWSVGFRGLMDVGNPLSLLRMGYVLCGNYVLILSGILRNMTEQRTGKPFAAHYTNAHNHIICAVSRGNDHILLDPNLGFFVPSRDNTHLATSSELRKDPSIVRRVVPGRVSDYNTEKFFFSIAMRNFPDGAAAR